MAAVNGKRWETLIALPHLGSIAYIDKDYSHRHPLQTGTFLSCLLDDFQSTKTFNTRITTHNGKSEYVSEVYKSTRVETL
jgi:hypothetical protein